MAAHHRATRTELHELVGGFLRKEKYPNESVLEISGNTPEWKPFFKLWQGTVYPQTDAHNLPHKDNTFSAVIVNQVLEHVRKPWVVMKEVHRVRKPGGIAIVSSPFMYQVHLEPEDNWRFTIDGLKILCEDFSKVRLEGKTGNPSLIKYLIDNPKGIKDDVAHMHMNLFRNQTDLWYLKSVLIVEK